MESKQNQDLHISRTLAFMKADINKWGLRVIANMAQIAREEMEELIFNKGTMEERQIRKIIEETAAKNGFFYIKLSDLSNNPKETNHTYIKQQLEKLQSITYEYENEHRWDKFVLFSHVGLDKDLHVLRFEAPRIMWYALMNTSSGWRRFESNVVYLLDNQYAIRIYWMITEQNEARTFDINEIKQLLGAGDKYQRNQHFIEKVIIPAKEELDSKSPYSFNYELHYNNPDSSKKRLLGITIHPVYIQENRDQKLAMADIKRRCSFSGISNQTRNLLKELYGFTTQEILNNQKDIMIADRQTDLYNLLKKKATLILNKNNPKGYVIKMIQTIADQILTTH